MCGINGIIYFGGRYREWPQSEHAAAIKKMNDRIAHRGPDGEGLLVRDPISFGHRRLSIIDLSDEAAQPMCSDDQNIVIVFNGEIYNYLELAEELRQKGYEFRTRSDTEVIIQAYCEYGTDCVRRFNGMWAFALYDFKKNLFFASRDRMGVKPFFYFLDNGRLIFSSEIKAVLELVRQTNANRAKAYEYLAYGYKTNDGETLFENIHELRSGHNLTIADGRVDLKKYWSILDVPYGNNPNDLAATIGQFSWLLSDAIKLRFRSDVPVAILLSGGLDSSTITKTVDLLIARQELHHYSRVNAFSAVFPGYEFDESGIIKKFISSCRNIELNEIEIPLVSLLDEMEPIIYGLEEPVFSSSALAHFALTREIKNRGMKVVLNGQGSDESFIGYDGYILGYYLFDELLKRGGRFWSQLRAIATKKVYSYPLIFSQIFKALLTRRYASYLRAKYQERSLDCFDADFIRGNRNHLRTFPNRLFHSHVEAHLKANLDYEEFTRILHLEDHSSMQNSIEIRSPFIDYRLIEFAFSLPTKLKYDRGVTKLLVRKAMEKSLPACIIDNPRKLGFPTPFADWLNLPKFERYVRDLFHSPEFRRKKIWNPDKILEKFLARGKYKSFPFWRIINFELWSRVYHIDNL